MKLIFSDKITRAVDKVWATRELKYNGIADEILKKVMDVFFVIVIVHFEETLEELKKVTTTQELKCKLFKTRWAISNFAINRLKKEGIQYAILLSDILSELIRYAASSKQTETKKKKIHIIAAEHYPIPDRDESILTYAAQLSQFSTVSFHSALDEPLFKLFGAEGMSGMLKQLGWNKKASISHSMITSAMGEAQRKIKKQSIGDQHVGSMKDWFYYNCPQSRTKIR
jgi:hypothetical protein